MGSSSLTAISSPALAPCACSAGFFMVPNGPPVLVATSKVPAECQLRGGSKVVVSGFPNRIGNGIGRRRESDRAGLREAEHERGAVLLGDKAAELALGLVDRL